MDSMNLLLQDVERFEQFPVACDLNLTTLASVFFDNPPSSKCSFDHKLFAGHFIIRGSKARNFVLEIRRGNTSEGGVGTLITFCTSHFACVS